MSSDGNDGAGGVGGNDNASTDSASKSTDSLSDIAESLGQVAEAVAGMLGSVTDAAGLSDALGALADAFGLEAQDLQGLVGAALMGAVTGGLPGAVMGVVNALAGGSLTAAARDAVADNLPAAFQPFANAAIDAFASRIPGANVSANPQNAIAALASGALTNGRVPGLGDLSAVARDMQQLSEVAGDLMSSVAQGDYADAAEAATALGATLDSSFAQASDIAGIVAAGVEHSRGIYGSGGHGDFGDAVENLAVSTARMMAQR